jgi:hypothetical protein
MLHTGKLILQNSTRFAVSQKVIVQINSSYSVFEVTEVSDMLTIFNENTEILVDPSNVHRLVISNGEKFAPLQNMDWPRVIEDGQIDFNKDFKYYLVERRSRSQERPIVLAKIVFE